MPRRKRSPRSGRTTCVVQRRAPKDAPREPSARQLGELFSLAWDMTPVDRRPNPSFLDKLAADVILKDDQTIAELNAEHMGHEGPTDVLSFPMCEPDPEREAFFLGEIIVGYEVADREASSRGLALENEMSRYAIHGFLHLLGYEDDDRTSRREMEALQEAILERFFAE